MPSSTVITLTDSDAVTTHDYSPVGSVDGVFNWKNIESATSFGRPVIRASIQPATAKRRSDKVHITLTMPVETTVDSVVEINDTIRFNGEFLLPANITAAQRANFLSNVTELIAHSQVSAYAKDLEQAY